MFININQTNEEDYFKKAVLDNLKFVVLLEFVINLYVFDLWVELLLVPILAIIGAMLGFSSTNPRYKQIESCSTKVMAIFGIGFLAFALYNILIDVRGFASMPNFKEFLLPVVFTVAFLPFIYLLALYITYDLVFMRLKHLIKNPYLARYAKVKTIFVFHLNLRTLNKWLTKIVLSNFGSKEDINRAINELRMSGA